MMTPAYVDVFEQRLHGGGLVARVTTAGVGGRAFRVDAHWLSQRSQRFTPSAAGLACCFTRKSVTEQPLVIW